MPGANSLAAWPRTSWWPRAAAPTRRQLRLRLVVEQARKVSMPKETLERAIKKGAGLTGETVHFEHVMYEGFAPHQVPLMVECLTDNVKRTAPEMRVLFRKGQLGTSGSVAWDFDHVGMIEAEPAVALVRRRNRRHRGRRAGPGARRRRQPPCSHRPDRPGPRQPRPARPRLHRAHAKLGYKPKNPVDPASLSAEQLEEVEAFLAAIDAQRRRAERLRRPGRLSPREARPCRATGS
jgi:hypothetical protein